jgi:hypothetical protein
MRNEMRMVRSTVNSLYLYRSGYLKTLNTQRFNSIVGKSFLFRLRIVFTNTLKEFKLLTHKNPAFKIEDKIVCIINSKNNYESLKFLNSEEVVYIKPTVLGDNIEDVTSYRFKGKFFYSLIFILYLPYLILKKENRRDLILLHKAFGLEHLFHKTIIKHKPRKVIFANDHIPEARSFVLACQKAEVETVYIQHGSVSKYFPPLEFNLALLESQYSKDIYAFSKNITTKVELIGIPKLDKEINKIRQRSTIKTVGLAINQNDDLPKVESLIEALTQKKYQVILRKHPADLRKFASQFEVQGGNHMSVFDFIHSSDFIVASDSSIHVEANSLKCRSIYYKLHNNNNKYDYYGFVKNGFIKEVKNQVALLEVLNEFNYSIFDFNSSKLAYYNEALIGGKYGMSSELAKKYIYEGINS